MMWRTAVRLVLATALVLAAAHWVARDAVKLLLPVLAPVLGFVAGDFKIVRLEFVDERKNASIAALAVLERPLFLDGRAIVPDGSQVMVVGTTLGTVLQPLVVALVLVLAWPARWGEMALRLAIASALLAVVLLADTPFSLAAWLWDAQLKAYEPGRASPLVWWNVFLNGGGRLALGLIAGALAIALAQRVTVQR
ncbi:MAG: hypothetical protein H7Y33_09810 [Cytophagales bacterium]|nr:hypothetical protein [Rhizobacter sp.]